MSASLLQRRQPRAGRASRAFQSTHAIELAMQPQQITRPDLLLGGLRARGIGQGGRGRHDMASPQGARRWSIVCLKSAEKEVGQSLSSGRYWGWFRIEPPPPERCPSASSGALRQWVGLEAHQEARPAPTVVLQYCCCCGLLGERRPALPDALTTAGSSRGCHLIWGRGWWFRT